MTPWSSGSRILAAGACAIAAAVWALAAQPWSAPACGATLGVVLAAARADALRRAGGPPLPACAVILAAAAASGAFALAVALLPELTGALLPRAPPFVIAGCSGALLGLWTSSASIPVHLPIGEEFPA